MRAFGIVVWIVLIGLALAVVCDTVVWRATAGLSLNYGEGFLQLDAEAAARGEPLYGDPSAPPWTLQVYTPLYPWLTGLLLRAGGAGYLPGRLLGYGALLATALLIGWSGQARTGRMAWAVAAVYLTLPISVSWGAVVRPDNLAVLFSAAGLVAAWRGAGSRRLYAALPLFLLAGLTKQASIAAPLAALLWLGLRDRAAALRFAALGAGLAALAVLALHVASDGRFWLHAVQSHAAKPFAWQQAFAVWRSFASFHAPWVGLGVALLVACGARGRLSPAVLWLALSTLATLSAGKSGSDTNYFLEPVAALALAAAHELPRWPGRDASRIRRAAAVAGAAAALLLAAHGALLHRAHHAWIPRAEHRFAEAAAPWTHLPGPVVADDAGLLLRLGKPLLLRPFIMTQLAQAGLWDETPLLEMLRRREIALLVLQRKPESIYGARYTVAMRRAISRHYRRFGSYTTDFEYELWVPRPPPRRVRGRRPR